MAPAISAVRADIEAGPVVDEGSHHRRRLVGPRRQVGGESRRRKCSECSGCKQLSFSLLESSRKTKDRPIALLAQNICNQMATLLSIALAISASRKTPFWT